ncbi:MAG: hypothetical protein OQJ76_09685, partial [Rhodospirillales bacterium]|nr:hypothetical protein [Rhodospirillales bacterium]
LKSTGPRTAAGKARSAQNAVKHGLFSRGALIRGEDPAAFAALRRSFARTWKPVGETEARLVDRLAALWWRMERIVAMEAGFLAPGAAAGEAEETEDDIADAAVLFRVAATWARPLDVLSRHETRLERAFNRTIDVLRRIQQTRRRSGDNGAAEDA